MYTYAGIAKINEDWLRGEPLRAWLANRDVPYISNFLGRESTAYMMSYCGLIYDLIVAELLLFKKTLVFGILCSLFFHVSNKIVFNIGIFPWMMIASTPFFFAPYWPKWVISRIIRRPIKIYPTKSFAETAPRKLKILEIFLLIVVAVFLIHQVSAFRSRMFTVWFIYTFFLLIKVAAPLRFHTYPGTVAWNEYGHQFSWRMKLRTKYCDAFALAYSPQIHEAFVLNPINFLNRRQYRKMASRPDMIMQFAHHLGAHVDAMIDKAIPGVNSTSEVYIESWCALNSRPYQPLTIPTINIRNEPRWSYPYSWVTEVAPLTEEEKKK